MKRRDFLTMGAVTPFALRAWPLYLPMLERAPLVMAKGWGLGISYQMHMDKYCGLEHTLRTFDPVWWHDWSHLISGATPSIYEPSYYTDNPAKVNELAKGWKQVLWCNEPELPYGAEPRVVADAIKLFRVHNPHVKVYGFGSVNATFAGWLHEYKLAGGELPDGWHFHCYMHKASEWQACLARLRTIAGDKPILISECGGWGENTPEVDQLAIMDTMRLALDKQEVEAVAWFCARPKGDQQAWYPNALLDEVGNVTTLGKHWLELKV